MLKLHFKPLALLGSLLLAATTFAQDSGPLIDLLVKKGIVNDQEAEELRADLVRDFAANTSAGKLNMSSNLSEFKISGDARIRYEYRQGQDATGDNVERARYRYRLRPTFSGKLGSDWFFGFRLENSASNRSSNVTMGDAGGPWSKTNEGVYIGQAYIGYTPTSELTFIGGRMPNPFVSTLMVWDADINPEGLAEQFKRTVGATTFFANLGQFIYDSANPQNSLGTTTSRQDQYLLGWQGGATIKLNATTSLQVAPTLYNYVNNKQRTAKTFGGAFTPAVNNAVNNLMVIDVPFEISTTLPTGAAGRVFGDVAYNLDGSSRARKYGRPDLNGEVWAWQLGVQYGKAKLKGEWDAKLFYQQTDIFALDPNLVDSDLFDSRVNTEGVVVAVNYQLSDAVSFMVTGGNAKTKNKSAISPGSGDIGIPTLNKFNLLQFDIVAKF
jgi:polyhydroxyalkanoate synthesis regulator phasin